MFKFVVIFFFKHVTVSRCIASASFLSWLEKRNFTFVYEGGDGD